MTDAVTLGGDLSVELPPSFGATLVPSDSFIVLEDTSGGTISGSFANVANGERISTSASASLVVNYGAGSPYGADRVVLDDYVGFPVVSTLTVSGTASGGTVTIVIEGVEVVVALTAGMTAEQIAAAIADAINNRFILSGIVAVADGVQVLTNGLISSVETTDPGILFDLTVAVPAVPGLSSLALALLAGLLGAAGSRATRRLAAR